MTDTSRSTTHPNRGWVDSRVKVTTPEERRIVRAIVERGFFLQPRLPDVNGETLRLDGGGRSQSFHFLSQITLDHLVSPEVPR